MSPGRVDFQDPIIATFWRILKNSEGSSWDSFLEILSEEVRHVRQRQSNITFSRQSDPMLVAVNRVLRLERAQLNWERLIVIGCSAGGDLALRTIFQNVNYPHIPIIIAMHHNPGFRFLAKLAFMNGVAQEPALIASDMAIKAGELYFVPGESLLGYHRTDTSFTVSPTLGPQRFRPAINTVLRVTGERFKDKLVAVILTGMLDDGADGLKDVYLNHGEVMIQKTATALFDEMPQAAMAAIPSAQQKTLEEIAGRINDLSAQYLNVRSFKNMFRIATR